MEIRAGYDIAFQCFQDTPMILMLSIEPARMRDLLSEHRIQLSPSVPSRDYVDMFGNTCTRIVAPAGLIEIRNDFRIAAIKSTENLAAVADEEKPFILFFTVPLQRTIFFQFIRAPRF